MFSGNMHLNVTWLLITNSTLSINIILGTKYIVADCGGGTVDITIHEIDDQTGNINELYKATGGPHGSIGNDL